MLVLLRLNTHSPYAILSNKACGGRNNIYEKAKTGQLCTSIIIHLLTFACSSLVCHPDVLSHASQGNSTNYKKLSNVNNNSNTLLSLCRLTYLRLLSCEVHKTAPCGILKKRFLPSWTRGLAARLSPLSLRKLWQITHKHKMPHDGFLTPDRSLASAERLYLNPTPAMMDIGSDLPQPPSLFDGALIGKL